MSFESLQFWAVTVWMILMLVLAAKAVRALLRDNQEDQATGKTETPSETTDDSSESQNT
jgi:hypothetical protein